MRQTFFFTESELIENLKQIVNMNNDNATEVKPRSLVIKEINEIKQDVNTIKQNVGNLSILFTVAVYHCATLWSLKHLCLIFFPRSNLGSEVNFGNKLTYCQLKFQKEVLHSKGPKELFQKTVKHFFLQNQS
jgi:hypothetical protein